MSYSLETVNFRKGGHLNREDGMCFMEAVSYIAGEEHSDQPKCADPTITTIGIALNDGIDDDDERTQVMSNFLWRIPGTYNEQLVNKRVDKFEELLVDWQNKGVLFFQDIPIGKALGRFIFVGSIFSKLRNVKYGNLCYNEYGFDIVIKPALIKLLDELIKMTEITEKQTCVSKEEILIENS